MSRIDIVIFLLLALGAFLGYKKGFLMELFFFVAIILGVFIGFKLMDVGMAYLQKEFNADKKILPYISFLLIFLVVVVAVYILGRTIKNSIDKTFLGKMDAVTGAALGVFKYAFCLSILFWLAKSLHYAPPDSWTKGSWLFPVTADFAPCHRSSCRDRGKSPG